MNPTTSISPIATVGVSPRKALTSLMLVLLIAAGLASEALAQKMEPLAGIGTTKNRFVQGIVEPGSGLVTWYSLPGPLIDGSGYLSFQDHSYLSLMIEGKLYSNNDNNLVTPNYVNLKSGGNLYKIPGPSGTQTDTVRCIWNEGDFDIVQDVYPQAFEKSGQIIIKISFNNRRSTPLTITGGQYLLDVNVRTNDRAKVLTRWGYSPNWNQYPNMSRGVPPFYITFEHDLPPGPPTYDPGAEGTGYTDSPLMGLTLPSRMTIGDWTTMITWPMGIPSLPMGAYGDNAILFEWNSNSIAANTNLGTYFKTSYGTGEYEECSSGLYALIFYPHRLKWNALQHNYIPNPFTVEALVFNPSGLNSASNASLKLTVGDSLKIMMTSTNIDKVDSLWEQHTPSPASIPPLGVSDITWTVRGNLVTKCTGDLNTYLNVEAVAGGISPPYLGQCQPPIVLECTVVDADPPIVDHFTAPSRYDTAFQTHDDRPNTDDGLQKVSWNFSSGPASNFVVRVNNSVQNSPFTFTSPTCPKTIAPISIHQIDSTIGGCLDFTITDCGGNSTYLTICMPARLTHPIPDTVAPRITLVKAMNGWDTTIACSFQIDSLLIADDFPADSGLLSVDQVSANNIQMELLTAVNLGDPHALVRLSVIKPFLNGSITIRATDRSVNRNKTDYTMTYCTKPDTNRPVVTVTPVPIKGTWHVTVTDSLPWDRGIDTIEFINQLNVNTVPPLNPAAYKGKGLFEFDVNIIDTFKRANFCVGALDLATPSNHSLPINGNCNYYDTTDDIWIPNIKGVNWTAANGNPGQLVNINDIHYSDTLDQNIINWDTGIDSVWFIGGGGMTFDFGAGSVVGGNLPTIKLPYSSKFPPFPNVVPQFKLWITDTSHIDTASCITVFASDARGHVAKWEWCYYYNADVFPPTIAGVGQSHKFISLTATDDTINDRGIDSIWLPNPTNFNPLSLTLNHVAKQDFKINVATVGKSSFDTVCVLDDFGKQFAPWTKTWQVHRTSTPVSIWVQNLSMKNFFIITKADTLRDTVRFAKTDAFPLSRKGIKQFQFSFTLALDTNVHTTRTTTPMTFVGVETAGTASATWTVTPTTVGGVTTIVGTSATPLGDSDIKVPLVTLKFLVDSSSETTSTHLTMVPFVDPLDASDIWQVQYNGGTPTKTGAGKATALVPAPYGNIGGMTVLSNGYCSPLAATSTTVPINRVSLAPPFPNPFTGSASITYDVPTEGVVSVAVYDALGEVVQQLVDGVQKMGEYTVQFTPKSKSSGTYYVRLEAAGKVISRRISHER